MQDCFWLPDLIPYDGIEDWAIFEDRLYEHYLDDFVRSKPSYKSFNVNVRLHPKVGGRDQAFFHMTSEDSSMTNNLCDRNPDLRRCERIKWPRKVIENSDCNLPECSCDGIYIWNKKYKNYDREHLLFLKQRYLVVLERREHFYLFVTAFYISEDHTLRKKIKEYKEMNGINHR